MKRIKRHLFPYFLHTAVVYDTSQSLDAATFEKVLEKVFFLKKIIVYSNPLIILIQILSAYYF